MTFPGGYLIAAGAINNLGQVAGRGVVPGVMDHAVVWQNGSIKDLDPQQLHGTSFATDLTNPLLGHEADVQVVGTTGTGNAFLWVGGTMYDTSIPNSNGNIDGWGLAISNSGLVAGGYHPNGDASQTHAYLWRDTGPSPNHVLDPGELQDLNGLFPNATESVAEGVIDATSTVAHGQIVANALVPVQGGGQQWRAYLLTDQNNNGFVSGVGVTDLGALGKAAGATAGAINDVGQVVGSSGANAFRWQNGVMSNLGQLDKDAAEARAINSGGSVVGTAHSSFAYFRAFVWTGTGPLKDLNGLIPKNSGWALDEARGINDAGWIIGDGNNPSLNSSHIAYLLKPMGTTAAAAAASTPGLTDAKTASSALAPVDPLVLDDLVHWLNAAAKGRRTPAVGPR
jgi:probable HAF family extracellular repeat protein